MRVSEQPRRATPRARTSVSRGGPSGAKRLQIWSRLGLLALFVGSCAERSPPPPAAAVTIAPLPVTGPTRASALPDLERARLEHLFEAAALVSRDWPQLSAAETCILLVAETAQWIVNCKDAPAGFELTAQRFRERPVFAHEGDGFDSGGTHRSTRELLAQTPAAAHVFGPAAARTALPANHPWLLIGTLEALRAYHPAFGPATTEAWTSVAVHELVHIHQLRQPEFGPYLERLDRHALDPAALTIHYARDAVFHAQVAREYAQLVAAAAREPDAAAARAALRSWIRAYRKRSARLAAAPNGPALLADERVFTYLEGSARFVESDFLANTAQHPHAAPAGDPHFHGYAEFVGYGYAHSPNRQLDEQYYYALGYHLCVLFERIDPSWKRRVHSVPGWVIGVAEQFVAEP